MSDLLSLQPDVLFEQHSVPEIEQISKKLQNEIEKKKEELRTMVGERYRDLLKAADTINDMKSTATSVIGHIDNIITSCKSINDHQLIGFKTETDFSKKLKQNANNNYYGIVVQIKILTSLPEIIWSNLDNDEFFIATQLFIFSRHISTGLQLDANNSIMKYFPVAKRQWTVLKPFFFTIKQACMTTLEREDLTPEVASKCLASVLLLESCQIDKLLSIFIQLRGKAFLNILSDDNEKQKKVKDKLLASLKLLIATIEILFKCFIDCGNGNGHLIIELNELAHSDAKPTISLINLDNKKVIKTLPDIIAKYKPHINISYLSPEILQQSIQSWLQYIDTNSKKQLKSLFDLISSVKVIHDIKKQSLATAKPVNWSIMCQKLYLPANFDLYQYCYQSLINGRVKEIIKTSWSATLADTHKDIEQLIQKTDQSHRDMKKFVWTEESSDIPLSLRQALSSNKKCHNLLMKTKGYTPLIVNLCNDLDRRLEALFNDLSKYLTNDNELHKRKSEVDEDNVELIKFLINCSKDGIAEFITTIKSSELQESTYNYITLARLLLAVTELCPNLKLCLSYRDDQNSSVNFSSNTSFEHWDKVCKLLEEESLRLWQSWLSLFIKEWKHDSSNWLNRKIDLNSMLQDFPNWETITIEEKDEQENTIQSIIRVPSQPSFPLQYCLHELSCNLNKLVPHTMPKLIIHQLTENIIMELCDFYKDLSGSDFVKNNQNISLQLYFDIKFITLIFVTRDNKILMEKYNSISNQFKSNIDPFDFELFYNYLNGNIKKSGQRMQHQLGCLISNIDQLTTILGQQQTTVSQEKEPNVLALTSNAGSATWFPLLPVMTTNTATVSIASQPIATTNVAEQEKFTISSKSRKAQTESKSQSQSVVSTTQNYASNVKSGAAAFFGAMSQDWFRSS